MSGMQRQPWHDQWFCIGRAASVAEDGDHVTVDLADVSVTIQNFRGALAGFLNVCSHRSARMRACGRGRGLLRCPYHAWVYNRAGVPVGIPDNASLFHLTNGDREALALKPVAVAQRGGFLFTRVAVDGISLDGTLADRGKLLDALNGNPIAEHAVPVDRPWTAMIAAWAEELPPGQRSSIGPDFIIDRVDDWSLLRHAAPLSATRTMLGVTLFHRGMTRPDAIPPALSLAWRAAVGSARGSVEINPA